MKVARFIVIALGCLATLVTVLPILPSNEALIRVWDFPRLQVAGLLAAVIVGTFILLPLQKYRTWAFTGSLAAALAWQIYSIWPYTVFSHTQAKALATCEPESRLSLLVANVLIENREARPLLNLVERTGPGLVLLIETDQWWDEQLGPLEQRYPHAINHPQPDGFGMHLFSRFDLVEPEVRFLVEDHVPSIATGLRLTSGALVSLYGLHPRPPPAQDTEERDAELLLVAEDVRTGHSPSIVAGDLNDVAWSRTTQLFQDVSGLLDPRIGRGQYATFNVDWPLLKWPLDHVFFGESFRLLHIAVMEDIGSDHFPFFVELCHRPAGQHLQEQPPPEPAEMEAADRIVDEGLEE